jgi:tRNA1(Val) A37 N6-methylase TrmN6
MTHELEEPELATTADAFLGGKLVIRQVTAGSRAGLDAVFLAASCPAKPGETVLEAGAGSGIVSLALAQRVRGSHIVGVEIDPRLAALANANAAANGLGAAIRFIAGDVIRPSSAFAEQGLAPSSFDHVLANPPFLAEGEARLSPKPMLRRAHAATADELEGWVRFLAAFARPGGVLTLIHRADALPRLLSLLERRFGSLLLFPLFPRAGEPATRIIIQGVKGSRGAPQMRQGLVLHEESGAFTRAAEDVLRRGASLELQGGGTHLPSEDEPPSDVSSTGCLSAADTSGPSV